MQNMTVTSVAITTAKFLFGMCNCTVDSDVGMYNFLLVLGILWTYAHVIMRVSGHRLLLDLFVWRLLLETLFLQDFKSGIAIYCLCMTVVSYLWSLSYSGGCFQKVFLFEYWLVFDLFKGSFLSLESCFLFVRNL